MYSAINYHQCLISSAYIKQSRQYWSSTVHKSEKPEVANSAEADRGVCSECKDAVFGEVEISDVVNVFL